MSGSETMIKSKLITKIAEEMPQIPEEKVAKCVNTIIEQMTDTLAQKGRVEVRGFGSACLHHREPREARNPKTGKKVYTKGKYIPHFKPGKALRDAVNASRETIPILHQDHDVDADD